MAVYEDKERNTWFVDIRFRDSNGKVRSKKKRGFETEKKAFLWERKYLKESNNNAMPQSRRTVRDVGLEMVENERYDVKENTYDSKIKQIITFMPNRAIGTFSRRNASAWRNSLAELEKSEGKKYSLRYKNELINLLRSIFRYAQEYAIIDNDPTVLLKPFPKRYEDQYEYKVISPEQFYLIWNALKENTMFDIWFKYFVLLSFNSGARRAELKGLLFSDIKNHGIDINKQITGKGKDKNKIEMTKTKSGVRFVQLDEVTWSKINAFIETCKKYNMYGENAYVFGNSKPLSNNGIQDRFNKSDFNCRLHDLRHSHATLLIQNGVPINVVSKRLGHSTVEMTLKIYTHLFKNEQDKASEIMNEINSSWGYNGDTIKKTQDK